jgi:hypothetical protein
MQKINNVIGIKSSSRLNVSPTGDFFRLWVEFLKPIHNLSKKEMEVLAAILKKRYELCKTIHDSDIVDKMLLSQDIRHYISEECDVTPKHLNVVLSKMRKNGVLKDEKLVLSMIPMFDDEGCGLMIYFVFKDAHRIRLGRYSGVKET